MFPGHAIKGRGRTDVVVRSKHVGFEILWLVECKHWKSPVTKLHVLGLREIVNDLLEGQLDVAQAGLTSKD